MRTASDEQAAAANHTGRARLADEHVSAGYLGMSRSKFRELVAARVIPRVEIPDGKGGVLRRLLVDLNDLDVLIARWKDKR